MHRGEKEKSEDKEEAEGDGKDRIERRSNVNTYDRSMMRFVVRATKRGVVLRLKSGDQRWIEEYLTSHHM